MKKPATVRIKGSNWEVMVSESTGDYGTSTAMQTVETVPGDTAGKGANAILLDLAIKHFRGLRLTASEAGKLAGALRRSLKGESVDVGPIGPNSKLYNFRRRVNAISIRVGEVHMRLPLEAARALIKPLRHAIRPDTVIKTA
ncbi:MAG: hypothetical protein P8Z31_00070 [Gammaproteobacteria bacterium]|jgi:hypothetical protein